MMMAIAVVVAVAIVGTAIVGALTGEIDVVSESGQSNRTGGEYGHRAGDKSVSHRISS
jgi:hypothetical protein